MSGCGVDIVVVVVAVVVVVFVVVVVVVVDQFCPPSFRLWRVFPARVTEQKN